MRSHNRLLEGVIYIIAIDEGIKSWGSKFYFEKWQFKLKRLLAIKMELNQL